MASPTVDIGPALADARREAALPADGSPYCELMATHVVLGELLTSGRSDPELEQEYLELTDRLIRLGVWMERWAEQQFALWLSRITTEGEA